MVGAVVSMVVTVVICLWEWIENPGGIFHGADGTNWQFVLDTALSWLVPTFVDVVVIATLVRLLWLVVVELITKVAK